MKRKNITVNTMLDMKKQGEKISMITCYDYTMAKLVSRSGIDVILVGDSGGMVQAGYDNTLPVTVDEMVYHTAAVRRGAPNMFIVADLPFLSYHVSKEKTIENAGRLIQEGKANSVKLEGGSYFTELVSHLTACSIPVCGHLGMTPQSIHNFGGFRVQGREEDKARRMVDDAKRIEDAGAFALVLELVPRSLAKRICEALRIPVIGIGAGPDCDGQVLVINDVLGLDDTFRPKMVKDYAGLAGKVITALDNYSQEVKQGDFPSGENSFE